MFPVSIFSLSLALSLSLSISRALSQPALIGPLRRIFFLWKLRHVVNRCVGCWCWYDLGARPSHPFIGPHTPTPWILSTRNQTYFSGPPTPVAGKHCKVTLPCLKRCWPTPYKDDVTKKLIWFVHELADARWCHAYPKIMWLVYAPMTSIPKMTVLHMAPAQNSLFPYYHYFIPHKICP
jgi:hypothetical protein